MQPKNFADMPLANADAKTTVKRIALKEIGLFFSSPTAYLFLSVFAAVSLFIFFWGEAFFARNIADVRPLFEWMPVLLIFLCATLTMRLWSEERRSGTLEFVHTQSVPLWHFVVGKFLGCLFLLIVAMLITLPLPITVSLLGELDWGPVWAGYLATLLLGAAYLSIGLFVSSRSENQIVSLISACVVCGAFYVVGTPLITDFFGHALGDWLRQIGTGSRFDAITRGVIDIRDLVYYLSLVLAFLALNIYFLERERWVDHGRGEKHVQWNAAIALLVANAIGINLWLGQLTGLRIDATESNQYSISEATEGYLNQLQEPLLIRGYFSSKTHPLLSPLVPQLRDLITEYEVAGRGRVRTEFIDPMDNPELEEEAGQKFGIRPVPFQVADRYQASIVSSYFDVLVQYGDEHHVLSFRDLIEVKSGGEGDIDVQLRNPEHDLTRAIKTVLNSYQAGGNLFDTVKTDLALKAYISADEVLPEQLKAFKGVVRDQATRVAESSLGRFTVEFVEPEANGGAVAQQIADDYGFRPMATSLLSNDSFFFYLTLQGAEQIVQLPLGDLSQGEFERNLNAGIKRFATGFTKKVTLVAPTPNYNAHFGGQYGGHGKTFSSLEAFLGSDLNVSRNDLSDGIVPGDTDLLVLAAPKELTEKQVFAVDQFLMKGGTVIAATSPYSANLSSRSLSLSQQSSGIEDWLAHHGLTIEDQLVLDPQNSAFPVPVTRNLGGFAVQELRMLDYPYFPDIRREGLNQENLMTAELGQLTMAWASPISLDDSSSEYRTVTPLIESSNGAWLSDSTNVVPQVTRQGTSAFTPQGPQASHVLGVVSTGRFESFFKGKPSPLVEQTSEQEGDEQTNNSDFNVNSVIERSSESARIILFASNDFLSDQVLNMIGTAQRSEYMASMELIANAIDWSLEDSGLLSIRSRGHFNRTLDPLEQSDQAFWEYLNYGLAVLAIAAIALWERRRRIQKHKHYLSLLAA